MLEHLHFRGPPIYCKFYRKYLHKLINININMNLFFYQQAPLNKLNHFTIINRHFIVLYTNLIFLNQNIKFLFCIKWKWTLYLIMLQVTMNFKKQREMYVITFADVFQLLKTIWFGWTGSQTFYQIISSKWTLSENEWFISLRKDLSM